MRVAVAGSGRRFRGDDTDEDPIDAGQRRERAHLHVLGPLGALEVQTGALARDHQPEPPTAAAAAVADCARRNASRSGRTAAFLSCLTQSSTRSSASTASRAAPHRWTSRSSSRVSTAVAHCWCSTCGLVFKRVPCQHFQRKLKFLCPPARAFVFKKFGD
eukprot:TRINITY_DN6581_c0_g1_i2.p1 TRINITY_DN6581_c0_g1~~TRINITY_DN6581_c0_g1_i2.p1  ORF type:complete len:160 (+),score=8.65 TRINITY_DN6581_c0_g1_i2:474-953(+)